MFTVMGLQGPASLCGPFRDPDKLPIVPCVYM